MKIDHAKSNAGTVLITAMMTITILTLICATSLYVTSQNQTTGMQTANWHQALTAAESGVDKAVAALNTNSWTGWKTVPYSSPVSSYNLPTLEPTATATPSATSTPDSTHYNFLPHSQISLT